MFEEKEKLLTQQVTEVDMYRDRGAADVARAIFVQVRRVAV